MKQTPLIVLVILITLACIPAQAQAQDVGLRMEALVGFDGYCRSEGWCPVYVVLSNEGSDVEGELRVFVREAGIGIEPDTYARPLMLPAHSRKAHTLLFPSDDSTVGSILTVQLLTGGDREEVLLAQQVQVAWLDDADWLYGVASNDPSALNFLSTVAPSGRTAKVAHLNPATLPSDPLAWEGLDVLVLNDVDTTSLSRAQRQALERWVMHGGHLVVGGGAGAARTVAGVADLLPVTVQGTRSVENLWALGEQVGAPVAVGPYAVAEAELRDGEVLIAQDEAQGNGQYDLILVARRSHGAGQVDFLTFDAGLNPFTRWDDNALLWEWILGVGGAVRQRFTVHNEYNAREAVNAIPGLEVPSTLQLLAFMLVYTLLVGPVNYLVLRKLDRREFAWLTIPALVLGFTACAYLTGFQIRGTTAIVHRLALVYVPADAGEMGRVSEMVGVFSPRRTSYDVRVMGAGVRDIPPSYLGPERQPLRVIEGAESSTLTGLRVDIGGIQPFFAEGYADVPGVEADLRLVGDAAGGLRLEGTLRNGETPLEEAVLIVGMDNQRLGDLDAGEEASVRLMLSNTSGIVAPHPWSSVAPSSYNWPEQILGTGSYWEDRERYRRYQFLQALFPYDKLSLRLGVYLMGWADEVDVPLQVEVVERPFSALGTALYVYDLPVTGLEPGATVVIPPSLIMHQVEEVKGEVNAWPEGFHIGSGAEVVLRFTVLPELSLQQVDELILDWQGTSYGGMLPAVSLWNRELSDWEPLGDIGWGRHTIVGAEPYSLPQGNVLMRLETQAGWSADVESLMITIKGRR